MALALKRITENNLIGLSYRCISFCYYFCSHIKQLYISNKMERFSYKGKCGVWEHHMCIEEELPSRGYR